MRGLGQVGFGVGVAVAVGVAEYATGVYVGGGVAVWNGVRSAVGVAAALALGARVWVGDGVCVDAGTTASEVAVDDAGEVASPQAANVRSTIRTNSTRMASPLVE